MSKKTHFLCPTSSFVFFLCAFACPIAVILSALKSRRSGLFLRLIPFLLHKIVFVCCLKSMISRFFLSKKRKNSKRADWPERARLSGSLAHPFWARAELQPLRAFYCNDDWAFRLQQGEKKEKNARIKLFQNYQFRSTSNLLFSRTEKFSKNFKNGIWSWNLTLLIMTNQRTKSTWQDWFRTFSRTRKFFFLYR